MSEPCAKGHHHPALVQIVAPWGSTYWSCPEHAEQISRELKQTENFCNRPALVEEVIRAAREWVLGERRRTQTQYRRADEEAIVRAVAKLDEVEGGGE